MIIPTAPMRAVALVVGLAAHAALLPSLAGSTPAGASTPRALSTAVPTQVSDNAGGLAGNVEPALPATATNKVAVVANSAPVVGNVAIVIRNGTARAVGNVRVTAVAARPDGGLAVRARTNASVPRTIGAGELAIAQLAFRTADLPSDTTFTFKVKSAPVRSGTKVTRGALEVQNPVLSAPMTGPVTQTLSVSLLNPGSRAVKGPIRVTAVCFGAARTPAVAATTTIKNSRVGSGASLPATMNLTELCPSYLVGAYGV